MGFLVAALAHGDLHFEAAALLLGIVQLGIGVADLHPGGIDLEALDEGQAEIAAARVTERGSRADDKAGEAAMEDRKKAGYF